MSRLLENRAKCTYCTFTSRDSLHQAKIAATSNTTYFTETRHARGGGRLGEKTRIKSLRISILPRFDQAINLRDTHFWLRKVPKKSFQHVALETHVTSVCICIINECNALSHNIFITQCTVYTKAFIYLPVSAEFTKHTNDRLWKTCLPHSAAYTFPRSCLQTQFQISVFMMMVVIPKNLRFQRKLVRHNWQ